MSERAPFRIGQILSGPLFKAPAHFPWHEVRKVERYWPEVNALTEPIQVREPEPPYGGRTES